MPLSTKRLKNAPLVHVLAQVLFPPLPHWAERRPALKKALYDAGFIRTGTVQTTDVLVSVAAGKPQIEHRSAEQDRFIDADEHQAVTCGDGGMILQSTNYHSFGSFLQLFERALQALEETIDIAVVDRIGLRYIDRIQISSGERFGDYVHHGLLGFPFADSSQLGVSRGGFSTESVGLTAQGALAIRSAILAPGQLTPPDLDISGLRIPLKVETGQVGLMVDFDHYSVFAGPTGMPPLRFSVDGVNRHVEALHSTVKDAFLAIVTERAIERWGGWEEIEE